jgi:zonular occludens toxin Zot
MKSKFFYGATGSGKTLNMVKEGVRDAMLGRIIYSNMKGIKNMPYYYIDLEDLILMVQNEELDVNDETPKSLLLDEIHTMFDGRRSSSRANIDFSVFISQCRKRRFNVYYTSQWITGADNRIRTLTNELIRCVPYIDVYDYGYGDVSTPEPIAIEKRIMQVADLQSGFMKPKIKKESRWRNRPFYKYYDTFEVIRPVEVYT